MKLFAFTLDLEADYAGLTRGYEVFKEIERIKNILSALSSLGVKITVFVVGEIFEKYPDIIRIFEKYDCEFEAHSYSHAVNKPDLEQEIKKSKAAYFNYFGRFPRGYRVPQGRVSDATIELLKKEGFLYDSSLIASYYPNPFKYLLSKRHIHYYDTGILEIPISSITPLRLTLSLSYLKLLGINFYFAISQTFGLPEVICFSCHLHDFIVSKSYRQLSPFWKFIYGRNKFTGLDFCMEFLKYIKDKGYRFCFVSELYQSRK